MITGPTGTGKTTTIASMIGHINRTRRTHIVTIEDPIEVVHDDQLSIIQQREIGIDTDSYATALSHVIRQDPDVIFVGEIRDSESALAAIQAAETGHLVISTLHTIDCDGDDQPRARPVPARSSSREIRSSFAGALRGIVSQRLVTRADGKGRVPVVEVLVNTGRIFDRIVDPEQTAGDPRGDRRRRLLRDADVRPGAREPREGGPRLPGRGPTHGDEPARLRPRPARDPRAASRLRRSRGRQRQLPF